MLPVCQTLAARYHLQCANAQMDSVDVAVKVGMMESVGFVNILVVATSPRVYRPRSMCTGQLQLWYSVQGSACLVQEGPMPSPGYLCSKK